MHVGDWRGGVEVVSVCSETSVGDVMESMRCRSDSNMGLGDRKRQTIFIASGQTLPDVSCRVSLHPARTYQPPEAMSPTTRYLPSPNDFSALIPLLSQSEPREYGDARSTSSTIIFPGSLRSVRPC